MEKSKAKESYDPVEKSKTKESYDPMIQLHKKRREVLKSPETRRGSRQNGDERRRDNLRKGEQ